MDCKEVNIEILNYLEDPEGHNNAKEIEKHVTSCTDCNKFMVFVQNSFERSGMNSDIKNNSYFFEKVKNKLERKITYSLESKFRKIIYTVTIAAMILMGVFVGSFWGSFTSTKTESEDMELSYIYEYKDLSDLGYFPNDYLEEMKLK